MVLVGIYAAAKAQFGSGMKTTVGVSLVWFLAYSSSNASLVAYGFIPIMLVVVGTAWGLVELLLAGIVGSALNERRTAEPNQAAGMLHTLWVLSAVPVAHIRLWVGLLASGGLHAVLILHGLQRPLARPQPKPHSEVLFEIWEVPEPRVVGGRPEESPQHGTHAARVEPKHVTARAHVSSPRHEQSPAAEVAASVLSPRPSSGQPSPVESTPWPPLASERIDLSPAAAARTLIDVHGLPRAPSAVTAVAADANGPATEAVLAQQTPGLHRPGRAPLRERLALGAEDGVSAALSPWKLLSEPLRDGRYRYVGRGFDATIERDGKVRYREKDGLTLSPTSIKKLNGAPTDLGLGVGFADPGAFVERLVAGNDPHAVERREFLERTLSLREMLADRARAAALVRADKQLHQKLLRIWRTAAEPDVEHRQAASFALWDACSEDAVGDLARNQIEDFLRKECSLGSPCEFTQKVVDRLSKGSRSKRHFDLYASGERLVPSNSEGVVRARSAR